MANTLTLSRYGRYSTSKESDFGVIVSGDARAVVFDPISQNVWATTFRFFGGKAGGSTTSVRPSAYRCDGSHNPLTRIGYGALVSVTTSMAGGSGGATFSSAVTHSDNAPLDTAIQLTSGQYYALDLEVASGGDLNHSMQAASLITADNEQFYDRNSPGDPPPSSYGAYSASVEGHVTISLEGWVNVAPVTPSTGLAPSGSITSTTPTMTAAFRDLNGAYGDSSGNGVNTGDILNQYQIQVRRSSDSVSFWAPGTFDATSAEQAANAISQVYNGTALVRGTAYQWRVRMSDQFSAWSDWSAWTTFTPVSLGYVTLDGNPTGTIQSIQPNFEGRWNHQSATAMTQAQVRLLSSAGVVLQTSAAFAKAAASSALPGTLFTCTWANTGFTSLSWGKSYSYQIRGYDGSNWSDWSTARTFATNAAPTVPSLRSPSNGQVLTALPSLSASFSDADDTTGTGLTGVFRITRPDTTTVDVTPTYDAPSDRWRFQTTVTELNAFGVYSWKAIGYDGTVYSGGSTTLAGGTFSSTRTFDYELGPVVAVSSPANGATITTAALDVTWSVSAGGPQVKYQVVVYADDDSTTVIYDSGLLTSTATTHTIPSGYLRNNTNYDVIVYVTSGVPLTGSSSIVNIAVAFTPATSPTNFAATPVKITSDPTETAIRLSWDQTSYDTSSFVYYTLSRSADGGPDADTVVLAQLTSPTDVSFLDVNPASGYTYTYSLTISIVTGADTLDSDAVTADASVTLTCTVLTLMGNGATYRAVLTNVMDRPFDRQMQEAVYQSPASTTPITVRAVTHYKTRTLTAMIVADDNATAKQRRDDLEELDMQNSVICYRDGEGLKEFHMMTNFTLAPQAQGIYWTADFGLREETATEITA